MSSAMSEMPQDSVLRRHWQAARDMESTSSRASNAGAKSGFFGWLKSLFS